MLPPIFFAECLDCGLRTSYRLETLECPGCGSQWRQASYNTRADGVDLLPVWAGRPFDLWRYRELLPLKKHYPSLSMGEGGTPLIHAANLGMMLGLSHLYIKDERQGPTSSFKDRQAAVGIAALKEAGIKEVVLASTGNVAISYSAYAARAGIKLWAFLTSLVPVEKMREVAIYGTQVVKVTASYDQTKQVAAEFARQRGLYLERGARTIPSVEAMKTIAFEIAEQLTRMSNQDEPYSITNQEKASWVVPDWYFQSVSGGLGPLGVLKGFSELQQIGLTHRVPGMAIIQAEGCSPMVNAWKQDLDEAIPVHTPQTHIATLATGDPGRIYTLLRQRIQLYGNGLFESVSDEDSFRAMHILAKMEGLSVEPAAAVAFAGLIKLVRAGKIKPDQMIVVNCTGHTLPVESEILGENWAHHLTPLSTKMQTSPQEGLLSALSQITDQRFPRVLIVDDTPEARRLILRILRTQGDYTYFEAENGREAIHIAQHEGPDLIILDLMMPEIDGFAVLDALKADPLTAPIPVIVVTAKDLTGEEKERVRGRIHTLMQKGEFMNDNLLEEVRVLLN